MSSSTHSPISAGLLALAVWISPLTSRANPAEEEARRILQSARQAYDAGDFESALAGYSRAYEHSPIPALLFNMAQCHRKLGAPAEAAELYRKYLTLDPAPVHKTLATELLHEMETLTQPAPKTSGPALGLSSSEAEQRARAAPSSAAPSVFGQWWLWAGVGTVLLAGTATTAYLVTAPRPRPVTLGEVNTR
jgi:tetratricopeptide (TPR) repeat protein